MANYPRLIKLDKETEDKLRVYIDSELSNHYMERSDYIDDLLRWQRDYWAQPTVSEPKYPYAHGSATIIIPLSAIAIEAVHAQHMTTMFALPQFVSATAISSEWEIAEKAVERFLDDELLNRIKVREPIESCYLECEKFGTMIGKVGYEKISKKAVRTVGDEEIPFTVVVKDGAVVDAVSGARFLMRFHETNPQTASWVGEEHTSTPYELEMMEREGMFYPHTIIDDGEEPSALKAWISNNLRGTVGEETGAEYTNEQEKLENTEPHFPRKLDWVELWMAFDVDDDGENEEIVVFYHRGAQYIMGIRYNWNSDLRRPYRTKYYQKVEHRWRGIGICKMNEQFQKEITVQHRQRLDNATIANLKMFKIHKLSGYGPDEPIFPGKMWFLNDMDHLDVVPIGEVYASSFQNEQATLLYHQQRIGVNELTLGLPQAGTPGTATSDLARIQEGKRKSDYVLHNFREFTTEIIIDVASTIHQFGPRNLTYYDTAENGQLVRNFFQMPETMIRDGLLITLRSAGQHFNKILDRQNWQQIAPMLQQYYTGLLQLGEFAGNPQLMQLIVYKGMAASTEAMRQIFETFDTRNIGRMLVGEIESLVQNAIQGATNPNAAGGGTEGISEEQVLAQLSQIVGFSGGNGNTAINRISNAGAGI